MEEQDPLIEALELVIGEKTVFVLAYKERSVADRMYLEEKVLPRFKEKKTHRIEKEGGAYSTLYVLKGFTR